MTNCRSPSSDPTTLRRMRSKAAGSTQFLNGAPLRKAPGFARQDRHVMPWVVLDLAAAESALMLGDEPPVLADDEAVGVGVDVDRAPDRARVHRISVVVEPQSSCACASCVNLLARQVFDTEAGSAWNPSKRPP